MIDRLKKSCIIVLAFVLIVTMVDVGGDVGVAESTADPTEEELVPAFPGAEGYGKFTSGGRGGEVYHVTNLNDSGPGSLRDAVSESNRTIVFEVSGNIELETHLRILGDNITIAGQTAPGDGITVTNYPTYVEGDNIIIRYMRFRMGDYSPSTSDAMSARNRSGLMIDHSSFSWGVDEVLSVYDMENVTVQNSIISEALHMTDHDKGRHGFGGIWGTSTSYLNNIIAHNSSRNPRFKGTLQHDKGLDLRNNVIYNWNFYAGYGGNEADVNVINNYYKYGPDTRLDKRNEIVELPEGSSNWYIDGNYVYGYPDVTEDNWLGVADHPDADRLDEPVDVPEVTTRSALEAYEYVLKNAGAILPKRDAIDARVVADIRNGSGRQINSIDEVGGWANLQSEEPPLDSNRDGIPDEWKIAHGVDVHDDSWANEVNEDGYTNLEVYLHSIAPEGHYNPDVHVLSPEINESFESGTSMTIEAEASVEDAAIEKVEFYAGTEKLGELTSAPYHFTWENVPEGTHYVFARATSDAGMSTDATAIPIHVHTTNDISPWSSTDIGELGIPGHATEIDGQYIVKGDGNITGQDESLHYMYQQVSGDVEIIAQVVEDTKVAPHNREGVMIRESLDANAPMAMSGISVRGEDRVGVFYSREEAGARSAETDPIVGPTTPYWVRLTKVGDIVTGYISEDGEDWRLVSSMQFPDVDDVYIGLAVDAANENNRVHNLNRVAFSDVSINDLPPLPLYAQQFMIARGDEDLHLSWSEAERADAYHVQRSTVKGGPYETIATVTETEYVDSDVEADLNYFYVIRATNEYGDSKLASPERNGALLGSGELLTRLVDDDFENLEVGDRRPPGYDVQSHTDNNYIVVTAVPDSSTGNDSEKAIKLYNDSGSHTHLTRNFESQTGTLVFEADYMQEEMATFARAIRLMHGGSNNVEIFTGDGRGCEYDYCWYYRHQGDAVIIPENNRFSLNEWYNVRIEVDVPAQEFDIYINDTHSGRLTFQGSAPNINRFDSHTWGTANQYVDNIRISAPAMEAPQQVEATIDEDAVHLSWEDVADATYYNIYRKEADSRYQLIATAQEETQYTDTLEADGTYTYSIAAYNAGTGEGDYSDGVTVMHDTTPPLISIANEGHHSNGMDDQAPVGPYTLEGSLDKDGTVYVNGEEVIVGENGSFSVTVELHQGRNRIEIEAIDTFGNEAHPVMWEVVATRNGA